MIDSATTYSQYKGTLVYRRKVESDTPTTRTEAHS